MLLAAFLSLFDRRLDSGRRGGGRYAALTLRKLAARGVRASMQPVLPSKTFLNHYSIATGLLPAWPRAPPRRGVTERRRRRRHAAYAATSLPRSGAARASRSASHRACRAARNSPAAAWRRLRVPESQRESCLELVRWALKADASSSPWPARCMIDCQLRQAAI